MQRLKELINLKAFVPEVTDDRYHLRDRCKGKRLALVNYGNAHVSIAQAVFAKDVKVSESRTFESMNDEAWEYLEECSSDKLLAIGYGKEVNIALNESFDVNDSKENILKNITWDYRKETLSETQKLFEDKGYTIVRIQITLLGILLKWLETKPQDSLIAMDQGYALGAKNEKGKITKIRTIYGEGGEMINQLERDLGNGPVCRIDTGSEENCINDMEVLVYG